MEVLITFLLFVSLYLICDSFISPLIINWFCRQDNVKIGDKLKFLPDQTIWIVFKINWFGLELYDSVNSNHIMSMPYSHFMKIAKLKIYPS